jgi:hypothetical protein
LERIAVLIQGLTWVALSNPFGGRPQDLVLHGQLPDLALSVPELAILRGSVRPLTHQRVLTAFQEVIVPGASRCASTPSSRETTSSDSPYNSRSTASILPADHRGRDR